MLAGHDGHVFFVAFGPHGTRLATASRDKTAKVWDVAPGRQPRELLTLSGHTHWVNSVAFSPDGTRLATASSDKTVKLWDAASGRELGTINHAGEVNSVAFSRDGKRFATGSVDGSVHVYPVDRQEFKEDLMARARQQLTRALTEQECRVYLRRSRCPASP